MIEIKSINNYKAWNEFLEKEKDSQIITIAHNPSLGLILEKTFGYKSENDLIMKDDQLVGVMPTVVFRKKVVSIPHFSYGGPVIDSNEKIDIDINSLFNEKKFEIRSLSKISEHVYDKKITCILKVNGTYEEQLMTFKSKLRQKIRKAEKLGFEVVHGGSELLDEFYDLYAKKMLDFGSPPIGKVFFKNLLNDYEYGEPIITSVYDNGKLVATAFSLSYLNFNEVCWSATEDDYNRLNIHALICWEILKTSIDKKYDYFSFGRSTIDSNNHRFKRQWNPIELPIYYNYSEPVGKSIKELTFLTKIWKLQPLRTSVFFGHMISKYVY